MPQLAYCSNVIPAGWERFYPKGKGRRPNGKQGSGVTCTLELLLAWQQWQRLLFDRTWLSLPSQWRCRVFEVGG